MIILVDEDPESLRGLPALPNEHFSVIAPMTREPNQPGGRLLVSGLWRK